MQLTPDSIFEAAVQLPIGVRLELISRLMETVPGPSGLLALDDPNLLEELERRVAENGETISWDELKNEKWPRAQ